MGTKFIKTAVAVTLVTCVVVIVVSPFVDLPLTVQNSKIHVAPYVVQTFSVLDLQLQSPTLLPSFTTLQVAIGLDKQEILATYRC